PPSIQPESASSMVAPSRRASLSNFNCAGTIRHPNGSYAGPLISVRSAELAGDIAALFAEPHVLSPALDPPHENVRRHSVAACHFFPVTAIQHNRRNAAHSKL